MPLKTHRLATHAPDSSTQVIEILVADGYHPDRIVARAGVPIRVVFRRGDDQTCGDRVIFSRPRLERHLAPRAITIVDLPPSDGPEIRFTCAMGRFHGRIELLPEPATPLLLARRLRILLVGALTLAALVVAGAFLWVSTLAASLVGGLELAVVVFLWLVAIGRRRGQHSFRRS